MSKIKDLFKINSEVTEVIDLVRDKKFVSVFNLDFYQRCIVSSLLNKFVYIVPDIVIALDAVEEFKGLNENVAYLPPRDDVLSYTLGQSGYNMIDRLLALYKIAKNQANVVITTPLALAQLYPKKEIFLSHIITLIKKGSYDIYDIVKRLISAGYKRTEQIESVGQFAVRGDILDIYAIGEDAIRIEFYGDEIESIKYIDLDTKTSLGDKDAIEICPFTDIFLEDSEVDNVLNTMMKDRPKLAPNESAKLDGRLNEIALRLTNGDRSMNLNYIMPYIEHGSFSEFSNFDTVVFDECKVLVDSLEVYYSEHINRCKTLFERGEILVSHVNQLIDKLKVFELGEYKLSFQKLITSNRIFTPNAVKNFTPSTLLDYTRNYEMLVSDVQNWVRMDYKVVIMCGSSAVQKNTQQMFVEHPVALGIGSLTLEEDYLNKGGIFHSAKLVIIGTHNITTKADKKVIKRSKKEIFTAPNVGDFVVHNVHGIGLCESITKMGEGQALRDYLVIKYKDNDRLYVPVENMDSLSKYISSDSAPHLSKIGGKDFSKVKDKIKASVKAMAINLIDLYADRQAKNGHVYSQKNILFEEFSDSFPYDETADQLTAIEDGLEDLYSGKIMDRLLCGDVGYGKTEVALRLAFKVIEEGKQVAFLSPTTILAKQHYNTVVKRMEPFGVKVGSLTRFDSKLNTEKTLLGLGEHTVDIVCGTHRLLSKDVKFEDIGLLILDEEQRFGVADKEKIKNLRRDVNVLTLSATPIPRTLHMSMIGVRDISILDTPPKERIPVQTYVTEFSESLVRDAIMREVGRQGQVFVVYNRVETIDKFAAGLRAILPELKLSVAHGQMPENQLEKVIEDFVGGEIDVLISSTIIENGIDMPRANTMIVIDADRLGLSQLYQLRGRVGRSNRLAYVYFTYDEKKVLSQDAYKRLDAITQFTEFGSGFKIAMRDLEIRGAGNVLGREQHGHMEKVGYDMYCKLLSDAVLEVKGLKKEDKSEVKMLFDYSAYIPDNYIKESEWRLKTYSNISKLETLSERDKLLSDMKDIYGSVPSPVANLLTVALIKNLASKINASYVILKKSQSTIGYEKAKDIPKNVSQSQQCVLDSQGLPIIKFKSNTELLNYLIKI